MPERNDGRWARIFAVVRADVLIRVRRPSSIVVFLLLCVLAYMLVPDLRTGRTVMQVNNHRVLNNSAAIALATAGLFSTLLGMLGFYLISNTVRRDITTRTGFVIAAMPVRSIEYLTGKFLGNVAFLGLVMFGCVLNVMGMHLLRAEAPLEPVVYIGTYLAMTGPAILVIAALALLFECARPLSGRVGDVLYFFVWLLMVSVAAGAGRVEGVPWENYFDVLGMLFMLNQARGGQSFDSLQIGQSTFDPAQSPWVYHGIQWSWNVLETRLAVALLAVPLLLLAWFFFSRFDPARIRSSGQHARRHPLAALNRLLKPVTRAVTPLAGIGTGLTRVTLSELALTFMISPLALVWAAAGGVWAVVAPLATVRSVILPVTFVGIIAAISNLATRDRAAGTTALLYSMPRVQPTWVAARFLAATLTGLVFVLVPLFRILFADPAAALSLVIGIAFIAAAAVTLGTLTGGSKAFTAVFLLFLYLVMSARGAPGFDFAGWNGSASNMVRTGYFVATVILVLTGFMKQRLAYRVR
ncbi:MAG: hypothetical protein ABJD11_11810 [Gemmatimonadota bacterium]